VGFSAKLMSAESNGAHSPVKVQPLGLFFSPGSESRKAMIRESAVPASALLCRLAGMEDWSLVSNDLLLVVSMRANLRNSAIPVSTPPLSIAPEIEAAVRAPFPFKETRPRLNKSRSSAMESPRTQIGAQNSARFLPHMFLFAGASDSTTNGNPAIARLRSESLREELPTKNSKPSQAQTISQGLTFPLL
jgi:hypothetical protein